MTPAERDDAILEHLKRYHLTTPEVLHRLFFGAAGLNAVRKVTGRLTRAGKIRPCTLFEQRKYFVLTPREAVRLGEHRSIGRKFEYQGLVNAAGVLWFCVATDTRKFTPKEFAEQFPELVIPGVRSGELLHRRLRRPPEGRKSRMGFMLVDYGTSETNILKKIRKIIARGYTRPAFARLIQRENFVIAVIAPSRGKVEAIKAALLAEPPSPVRFRVEAVPELETLLSQRGRLRPRRSPQNGGGASPPAATPDEERQAPG